MNHHKIEELITRAVAAKKDALSFYNEYGNRMIATTGGPLNACSHFINLVDNLATRYSMYEAMWPGTSSWNPEPDLRLLNIAYKDFKIKAAKFIQNHQ